MPISTQILQKFLKLNKYDFAYRKVNRLLKSDSSDGILPLSNTLDTLEVENLVLELPKESFDKLPNYFIAQVSQDGKHNLVLVNKENNDKVTIDYGDNKNTSLTKNQFIEHWTGLAIIIEESKNTKKKVLEAGHYNILAVTIGVLFMLMYLFFVSNNSLVLIYSILSAVGLGFSLFILKEKYISNDLPSKFCTINKKSNCNAVLFSKYAKLFNVFDLSDISIIYFSFLTLSILYGTFNAMHLVFGVVSIPIILYSLYFQYFKIKKWCPLCLGIAFVLLCQSSLLFINHNAHYNFDNNQVFFYVSLLLLITVTWFQIKKLLRAYANQESLIIENFKFRRNHKLFLPFYESLKTIDLDIEENYVIKLGNDKSDVEITIVTNPFCNFCKQAHQAYLNLLDKYKIEIQINIIFLLTEKQPTNLKQVICEKLIEIYREQGASRFLKSLSNWYDWNNIDKWLDKWESKSVRESDNKLLSNHVNWCLQNEIFKTPSVLINGKLFPESYHFDDIKYFIEPILNNEQKLKNTLA